MSGKIKNRYISNPQKTFFKPYSDPKEAQHDPNKHEIKMSGNKQNSQNESCKSV